MFVLTAALILISGADTPAYTLEPAGIEFYYLPEYLTPPVEGVMNDESGAFAGQPNSAGVTFSCHYWRMDEPITDKDLWIEEKLSSIIPPDLMESIHSTAPTWCEGSMAAEVPSSRSLGLMSEITFTFTSANGVPGRGRSYGVFRNGYAVLLTAYGPAEANAHHDLEQIVGMAVLSR
jgi:hypothetical protein